MKKQLLSIILALLPMLAMADANGSCGTNVTYTFVSSTGTLTIQGSGAMTNYYSSSDTPWYSYKNDIKTVIIEEGVTSIGRSAFSGCSGLTSVTIPNGVTSIGNYAFNGCSGLTSVTIPNSVTSIGEGAFYGCSGLTSVTIGNSVTSIGGFAFEGCSGLTSITIPNSVTSIGSVAFRNCSGLTSITVAQGNTKYDSRENCNAIIETTSNTLIAGCKTTIIPNGVTSIGERAFSGCSGLTSITIPNSVTSIGSYAFLGCGLTSITISNNVASIGDGAFSRCTALASLTIPSSVTSVGDFAFAGLNLTSMTINKSDCSLMYRWFGDGVDATSIENIIIGANVSSVCGEINSVLGLESILVDANNTKYDSRNDCNAVIETATNTLVAGCKNSVIPDNVVAIGKSAFWKCSGLTTITIPNSVTSIGQSAFYDCSGLTSVTIPNSVTSIGSSAFYRCSGLTSVTIPNSVTSIGSSMFSNCSGLTSVTIPNSVTSIGESAFARCSGLTAITIPNNVTSIGSDAFSGCSGLTSVTIGNGVTSIGSRTFYNCSSLTSVAIGSGVTSIGSDAFYGCSGLQKVIVPDIAAWCGINFGVYESNPLYYAHHIYSDENTEIKDLVIPNSMTSIGSWAFSYCSGLTSVTIPNSVTSVGNYAFYNCSGLTSITIPNSVTSIGQSAFSGCSGLTYITIPNSVTSIGQSAFSSCSGLTSVTIGNSVTSIGSYAFSGCSGLTSIKSKIETPFTFGSNAFKNVSSTCVLTIPIGTRDAYIAAGWTTSVFKGGVVESENVTIAMKTGSGADRTMIGYSSQYSLDFTGINDVKAYIVIGFTDTKGVLMARVNVVPANTGVVLKSDVAGVEVEVPTTTSDVYYANLLKPAVDNVTIYPTEDIDAVNYTNLMVGKLDNEQMGFVTLPSSKAYSNKCYLQIPTAFYESATSARDGGMEMVFVDDETTDIRSLMYQGSVTNDAYYDLQGRKVIPSKKGIYIKNGKKVIVK